MMMPSPHSDALVFFGATGDLAYKKIFPALQALAARGHLNVPIVGVGRLPMAREQLLERVRNSVSARGPIDEAAFALARLRRAEAGLRGGPQAGDEAVRRVLEQASPESVRWLASRAVSYMDESGYPEAVEPWFQQLLDPQG